MKMENWHLPHKEAKAVMMGREEVGRSVEARNTGEEKPNVDWKLQQKRCLGLEGALKGESMGGFFCFILFSSC